MKKKFLFMIFAIMLFCFTSNVFAVDIAGCSIINGAKIDVKIANTVATAILIIQIAVPIVLVVFGMLDLFKGITAQKEEEIKKGQQLLIKRLITAAIVFFVIAIVKLLISLVADSNGEGIIDCANCFLKGANTTTGACKK